MTCDLCTRAPVGECVGEGLCASACLSDDDACRMAADTCLSWWQKRDEDLEIDDMLWEMSEQRIDELAIDPLAARAYLAERLVRDLKKVG
ncbi:Uncharacterised protein [uncultured archaeon]|nr:Uncharacterised protein [uncultured archaeon]